MDTHKMKEGAVIPNEGFIISSFNKENTLANLERSEWP
jgi:hypothetical protein